MKRLPCILLIPVLAAFVLPALPLILYAACRRKPLLWVALALLLPGAAWAQYPTDSPTLRVDTLYVDSTMIGNVLGNVTGRADSATFADQADSAAVAGTADSAAVSAHSDEADSAGVAATATSADSARAASIADTALAALNVPDITGLVDSLADLRAAIDAGGSVGNADSLGGTPADSFMTEAEHDAGLADYLPLAAAGDSVLAHAVNKDSVAAAKPYTVVTGAHFYGDPDYNPTAQDTIGAYGRQDSIGTGSYPSLVAYHPDTSSQTQAVDIRSLPFTMPPGTIGIDSIVCDAKTTRNSIDSCMVQVVVELYNGETGVYTFLDSTVSIATANTWTHDGTLTSFASVTRFSQVTIRIVAKSFGVSWKAYVARVLIYFTREP